MASLLVVSSLICLWLRRCYPHSWPILILGIAGILNQTAGYIIFPYVYKNSDAHTQLGIFGAASKIAMIMSMITQAFSLCLRTIRLW